MVVSRASKLFYLLCIATYFAPRAAVAQDQAPAQATGSGQGIEEIIVTAQKRTENLRAVPTSISVITGAQLLEQHIEDYADLGRTVPGLSFTNNGGPGLSNLEIRGVASTIGASTVSIYLDDAPISIRNNLFYSGQPEPLLFDLAQSEVLRGPQGTLYGAGAEGGTIRLLSNPVNLDNFGGEAYGELSGTWHGSLNYVFRALVNLPIVDGQLGLRIGAETVENSGFVDHANLSGAIDKSGINGDRSDVVKAALLYDATDDLTISGNTFIQRTHLDDTGLVDLNTPNYTVAKLVPEGGTDTTVDSSLKISYDLDWADLMSVSSFAYRHFPRTTDGTFFNSQFVGFYADTPPPFGLGLVGLDGNPDGNQLGALPGPVYNSLNVRQATEEVRLVSKPYDPNGDLPITWIVGLYYSDSQNLGTSEQYIPGFNKTFQTIYGFDPQTLFGPLPGDLFYAFTNRRQDREYAAFGEVAYYLTPALKFTAGMRYSYARDSETDISSGFFASTPFNSGNTKGYAATPKFSLTYDFDPNVTVYATVDKGFRVGGINAPVPAAQCAVDLAAFGLTAEPAGYASDKLWNYEAGMKGRFFGNQLSVNAAVFDIEWDKLLLDVPLPTCGFDFFDNLGHAENVGFEAEVTQRIGPELTLGFTGTYDHAAFTQAIPALGIRVGDPVPESPRWEVNLTADYEHDFTDNLTGYVRGNWQFIGPSHGTFVQTNQDYQRPVYNLLGMSIGAVVDDLDISLFVKNLLDEKKIIQRPADNFVAEGYTPVPRIIGIAANAHF